MPDLLKVLLFSENQKERDALCHHVFTILSFYRSPSYNSLGSITNMNITHDPDDLRFYAQVAGEEAELTYTYPEDTVLDFDYTYVPAAARNQGLADHLVKARLEFARANNLLVIPSCPVVEAYVKRHPEYQDLLT